MTAIDADRFVSAQAGVLADVEAELRAGRKQSHWMWFVFPQVAGLGHSSTARHYAIADLAQAQHYLQDLVLGSRLREHVQLLLQHTDKSAHEIFGTPDDLKLRSCLTLFKAAASTPEDRALFEAALQAFFDGQPDQLTLDLLRGSSARR
ncbi:MAG: hypothetical protein JWN07_993 [Hyphomicrobiales bacterium]|nr:hypothetical protein [Hyphomicrobiales bacterium]